MRSIIYDSVSKQYNSKSGMAVNHLCAEIRKGEFITILGSSGCGKTTLLKLTNRLLDPDKGRILFEGEDISKTDPVLLRRRMGYVIQEAGLFPHMTVRDNISVIPRILKWESNRIRLREDELLKMVGLDPSEFGSRYPHELSGGQQQRVGLARALVMDPDIMLMDEPFGAIDAITRTVLQDELKKIHGGLGKTFLLVTHDINEAFRLGNRVMVMNQGKLLQFDSPEKIVRHPANPFVRDLIESVRLREEFWKNV